jgi:hypothetical protein
MLRHDGYTECVRVVVPLFCITELWSQSFVDTCWWLEVLDSRKDSITVDKYFGSHTNELKLRTVVCYSGLAHNCDNIDSR